MPVNQQQHKLLAAIFKLTLRLRFHRLRMVTFSNNVEPANGFLVRYLHRKMMESENERNLTNEDLIQVLDWVPKLWYHLHTFLEKHSTSDFLIGIPKRNFSTRILSYFFPICAILHRLSRHVFSGPCFFLSCPVTVEEFRSWFIDLWNHSIIPYLQEGAKDGIKVRNRPDKWKWMNE